MGRNRGLDGPDLRADLESGEWRTRKYEVNRAAVPPNQNWFLIADFVTAIGRCDESE